MNVSDLIDQLKLLPPETAVVLIDEDTQWNILQIAIEYRPKEQRVYLSAIGAYPDMENVGRVKW